MIDREAISTPIDGEEPSGPWLRRDGTHAAVKEAMKFDPGDPDYGIPRKDPDWNLVISTCGAALGGKSKDFFLAYCLMEGLARTHGPAGLAEGLWVISDIHERFWGDFHPRPRDGDIEGRVNQLEMMLREWSRTLDAMPVAPGGGESLTILEWGTADDGAKNAVIRAASWESIDKSVTALQETEEQLNRFDDLVDSTYANMAPSLGEMRESLDAVKRTFKKILDAKGPSPHVERARGVLSQTNANFVDADWLAERLKGGVPADRVLNSVQAAAGDSAQGKQPEEGWPELLDRLWKEGSTYKRTTEDAPEPVEPAAPVSPSGENAAAASSVGAAPLAVAPATMTVPAGAGGAGAVIGACHAWRLTEPGNASPYKILRELRFAEVSNAAPPAGVREKCQSLFSSASWAELLELCESTVESSSCAGWLDLYRFSAASMGRTGKPYSPVRSATILQLANFLARRQDLLEAVLSDGMPAADAITRNWIAAEVAPAAQVGGSTGGGEIVTESADEAYEAAIRVLEEEGFEPAVQQLHSAAAGANGLRERGLRRRDLGELCLKADRPDYAVAILESLREDLHERGLGLWEGTDFMGRTLETLYKSYNVLTATQPDEDWTARIRSVEDELADVDLARRIRLEAAGS